MFAAGIDQMQQDAAALDMTKETIAEAKAFMRALDQAGDIGEHEFALIDAHDASPGCKVVKG